MTKQEYVLLYEKYLSGEASLKEQQLLENYQDEFVLAGHSWEENQMGNKKETNQAIFARLKHKVYLHQQKRLLLLTKIAVAATIMLVLGAGLYSYVLQAWHDSRVDLSLRHARWKVNNIAPGSNKAILTLASGETIDLSDAANGNLASQSGITITKTKDGQLVYTVKDSGLRGNDGKFNTISTPRGGQWQVNLPDGTKVWLNAASSLKYPTVFASNQRKVELTGEAYFEVAKVMMKDKGTGIDDKGVNNKERRMPFIVKTAKQTVEVLGTHFNINSYADEPATKTTLLEGSVRVVSASRHPELVSGSRNKKENSYDLNSKTGILKQVQDDDVLLKPGQQSILNGAAIHIIPADLEEAMAWKDGKFKFEDEDIESIMRKISRWYDIDVEYRGRKPIEKFGGRISRFKNISDVLDILELTKLVHFKIEGKKIIVMN